MKSNQRYIDRQKRIAVSNFDSKKLDYIQLNSNIKWIREQTIYHQSFSTPNKLRVPDLTCNGIILEHDTFKTHGELSEPNERTMKRNKDYINANIPFCIINQDLAKILQLDEAKLSVYLYYHTLSQVKARE